MGKFGPCHACPRRHVLCRMADTKALDLDKSPATKIDQWMFLVMNGDEKWLINGDYHGDQWMFMDLS